MRRLSLFVLILSLIPAGRAWAGESGLRVEADARIELLSVIFRLAGHPEYNMRNARGPYVDRVDAHFKKFSQHPAVQAARLLRRERGVSYDAPMSLAVHLRSLKDVQLRLPLSPWPEGLDRRWADEARTTDFVEKLGRFAVQSDFARFFETNEAVLGAYNDRLRAQLKGQRFPDWFARLFGGKPGLKVQIVASALNGGQSYGLRYVGSGQPEEHYSVIGLYDYDGRGQPVFSDATLALVAHEFAHSYANPLIDAHYGAIKEGVERLYAKHRPRMEAMAYGKPKTMAYETLVRALVQCYLRDHGAGDQARQHQAQLQAKGFAWSLDLAERLDAHRRARRTPDGLESFALELKRFFEQTAQAEEKAALERPKVLSMTPANGAEKVDPGLKQIIVVFDRPMRTDRFSVVGGGEHFPEMGEVGYRSDKRTFIMPVKLKPDWSYRFWLNSDHHQNFQSAAGVCMAPLRVQFATGAVQAGKQEVHR